MEQSNQWKPDVDPQLTYFPHGMSGGQPEYIPQPVPTPGPKRRGKRFGLALVSTIAAGGIFFAGMTYGENKVYKTLGQQPVATAPPSFEPLDGATESIEPTERAPVQSAEPTVEPSAEPSEEPDVELDRGGTGESSGSTEAAVRYGWGKPLPVSDEFDYGSKDAPARPDPQKWGLPGNGEWSLENNDAQCWPGHDGNGRRCSKNVQVLGGFMRLIGEENGDTGWVIQLQEQENIRIEVRSRSYNVGEDGNPYHVLHLIWPTINEMYPDHGEYDFVEYFDPEEDCLTAYMHYPHDKSVDTQQEKFEECPVDLTTYHNFGFEKTSEHLEGYIDGKKWFTVSGGSNEHRRNIQDMPSGHYNPQLDNFHGAGMRRAHFDIDFVRTYPVR